MSIFRAVAVPMPEPKPSNGPRVVVRRVVSGRIEAVLYPERADVIPNLELRVGGTFVAPVSQGQQDESGAVPLSVAVPISVVSDGISVLELGEPGKDLALAHVTIIAGEPLRDDLHSEVATLRAELAQIRAYLRRHAKP